MNSTVDCTNWKLVEDHITDSIKCSRLHEQPYLHLELKEVFPSDFYRSLLECLPDDSYYGDLRHPDALREDGSSTRRQFSLAPASTAALPDGQRQFWSSLSASLQSDALKNALFERLAPDLTTRFNCPAGQIQAYPRPALNRDTSGYRIKPHPDSPAKVLTVLLYLARSASESELGTTIYERQLDNGSENFVTVRSMPFMPNSGLAFAVTDRSWHGRDSLPSHIIRRDTVALTYFLDPHARGYQVASSR